jgi:hypothetical protein
LAPEEKLPLTSASKHIIKTKDHIGDTEQHTTSTTSPTSPDVVNEETPNKEASKRSTVDSNMAEETPQTLFRVSDWEDLG